MQAKYGSSAFVARWLGLVLALALCGGCGEPQDQEQEQAAAQAPATFAGSARCANCHAETYEAWQASHHAGAMQPASPSSVLARFPASLSGIELFQTGEQFFVREAGATHTIIKTFGVYPLQQYLVEADNGRLQALTVAWDSRAQAQGGQRWFDLNPEPVPPGDPLHWQGRGFNWNHMCADCHATDLNKGFNVEENRFRTTFEEGTVGCEACHGPASLHAENPSAHPLKRAVAMDTCAPCHSRRAEIAEGFRPGQPYLDHYLPELLHPPLYTPDAQIHEEVYVWGSFTSSKMFAAGVTCGDCHDPHAATPKIGGDGVCTQCHNPSGNPTFPTLRLADYESADHHGHQPATEPAACVGCHMPETIYMTVDPRRDHGFRVPRPDLGRDVKNPCTTCHEDKDNTWAAKQIAAWHGDSRAENAAAALYSGDEQALTHLAGSDAAGMLRATALANLARGRRWSSRQAIEQGLTDSDGIVRLGALRAAGRLPEAGQARALQRAFEDTLLAVRYEAVAQALALGAARIPDAALAEFIAAQQINGDTPEAHANLAMVAAHRGDLANAKAHLEQALTIEPRFVPALVNFADLMRQTGDDAAAGTYLAQAAGVGNADASYAFALWLVRQNRHDEALEQLDRAQILAPEAPRFAYAYALGLARSDRPGAIAYIERVIRERSFRDPELLLLAATLNRDLGRIDEAAGWANKLEAAGDPRGRALLQELVRP